MKPITVVVGRANFNYSILYTVGKFSPQNTQSHEEIIVHNYILNKWKVAVH